jgi:hypothetical protein
VGGPAQSALGAVGGGLNASAGVTVEVSVESRRQSVEARIESIEPRIHPSGERVESSTDVIEPGIDMVELSMDVIETSTYAPASPRGLRHT